VNIATFISFAASLLLFCMGGMFVVIARAPGWERARVFTLIAFSAALYAAVDVVFSLPWVTPETVRLTGVLNFFLATVHCSAWLVVAFSSPKRPLRDLSPRLKALIVVTLLLGLGALIPGVATAPGLLVIRVPALGVVYRQANTTPYADALAAWLLLVLCLPFARFVGDLRRGQSDALVRVIGFSVFFACAVGEALVSNGVVQFLYLADLGFLAIVLTLLVESLRRVMRDARALELLGQDLAQQVSRRTHERDEAREALAVAERHAALGQLAAGVGHEINNPLTYIRANLEHLKDALRGGSPPADTLELLDDALVGTKQIQRVVADLRSYALPSLERREPLDASVVLESALKLVSHELGTAQVVWQRSKLEPVLADPVRLRQVLLNLLLNASIAMRDANRAEQRLTLRAQMSGPAELSLEVEDNGVGIPASSLGRLGEPYFSSRIDRGGTGLGLFVARGIVDSLGGRLEFESSVGHGTTARVVLPTQASSLDESEPVLQNPEPPPDSTTAPRRTERWRVLIVDDEPAVARAIARQLSGMDVSIAHSGRAAVERLFRGEPVDLVLCDVMMPGGSGQDVYDAVAAEDPELLRKLLFITGGATVPEVATFLRRDGVRHLSKPFEREAFEQMLADIQAARPTAPALPVAPEVGAAS
jgi:signal transduction histidine kinase/CheY-like chemotaxis protein